MIAGKIRKRAGRLVGVDLAAIARKAAASRDHIVDKLGWSRSVIGGTLSEHWARHSASPILRRRRHSLREMKAHQDARPDSIQ
jgi:hypothetical protein